ncbi:MAG: hypothetical protein EOR67_13535 [Mesorhizobium sp.]|uniref:hypothetical protein n=1 Tax=Mesorhizobium sp. TaxID=1871066 RepID=UPI000FE4A924|nr:hypothetical protein [Mesorhizobium sp.]RWL81219.1 MAG: hypothetical protein EOR69_19085 [Mesorhizobium sp.]RWL88327.1 MAG: hypothetical protein EOR67_13535 [Mesorhizobium sp.]RWL97020.1 MAG: hypothetical protein EOR70_17735 [Mesorhizobium sp.]TJV69319.1 MAG: hypothetical protein E5X76_25175 [Mesorhizobium sp.]
MTGAAAKAAKNDRSSEGRQYNTRLNAPGELVPAQPHFPRSEGSRKALGDFTVKRKAESGGDSADDATRWRHGGSFVGSQLPAATENHRAAQANIAAID